MVVKKPAAKKEVEVVEVVETESVEQAEVVESVVEVKDEAKPATRSRAKAAIAEDELILCMNGTTGRYGFEGKNGYSIDLDAYGDDIQVPFGELKKIIASPQKKHLKEAWLIVLDEEAVELLGLKRDYENVFNKEQIENLLGNPDKIVSVFPKMSGAQQTALLKTAMVAVQNGELRDLRVVQAIKTVADVDIMA